MDRKKSRLRGFTLLELMIVIAILAVLAGILVPSVLSYIRFNKIHSANDQAQTLFTASQEYLTELQLKGVKSSSLRMDGSRKLSIVAASTFGSGDTRPKVTSASNYNFNIDGLKYGDGGVQRCTFTDGIANRMSGDFKGSWMVAFYPDTFTVAYVVYCNEYNDMADNLEAVMKVGYGGSSDSEMPSSLFTRVYGDAATAHLAIPMTQEDCAVRGGGKQYVGQYPVPFTR